MKRNKANTITPEPLYAESTMAPPFIFTPLFQNVKTSDIHDPLPPITRLSAQNIEKIGFNSQKPLCLKYVILENGELIVSHSWSDVIPLTKSQITLYSEMPLFKNETSISGKKYLYAILPNNDLIYFNMKEEAKYLRIPLKHPEIAGLKPVVMAGDFYVLNGKIISEHPSGRCGIDNWSGHYRVQCPNQEYIVNSIFHKNGFQPFGCFRDRVAIELKGTTLLPPSIQNANHYLYLPNTPQPAQITYQPRITPQPPQLPQMKQYQGAFEFKEPVNVAGRWIQGKGTFQFVRGVNDAIEVIPNSITFARGGSVPAPAAPKVPTQIVGRYMDFNSFVANVGIILTLWDIKNTSNAYQMRRPDLPYITHVWDATNTVAIKITMLGAVAALTSAYILPPIGIASFAGARLRPDNPFEQAAADFRSHNPSNQSKQIVQGMNSGLAAGYLIAKLGQVVNRWFSQIDRLINERRDFFNPPPPVALQPIGLAAIAGSNTATSDHKPMVLFANHPIPTNDMPKKNNDTPPPPHAPKQIADPIPGHTFNFTPPKHFSYTPPKPEGALPEWLKNGLTITGSSGAGWIAKLSYGLSYKTFGISLAVLGAIKLVMGIYEKKAQHTYERRQRNADRADAQQNEVIDDYNKACKDIKAAEVAMPAYLKETNPTKRKELYNAALTAFDTAKQTNTDLQKTNTDRGNKDSGARMPSGSKHNHNPRSTTRDLCHEMAPGYTENATIINNNLQLLVRLKPVDDFNIDLEKHLDKNFNNLELGANNLGNNLISEKEFIENHFNPYQETAASLQNTAKNLLNNFPDMQETRQYLTEMSKQIAAGVKNADFIMHHAIIMYTLGLIDKLPKYKNPTVEEQATFNKHQEKVLEHWECLPHKAPHAPLLFRHAVNYFNRGDYSAALQDLDETLFLDPRNFSAAKLWLQCAINHRVAKPKITDMLDTMQLHFKKPQEVAILNYMRGILNNDTVLLRQAFNQFKDMVDEESFHYLKACLQELRKLDFNQSIILNELAHPDFLSLATQSMIEGIEEKLVRQKMATTFPDNANVIKDDTAQFDAQLRQGLVTTTTLRDRQQLLFLNMFHFCTDFLYDTGIVKRFTPETHNILNKTLMFVMNVINNRIHHISQTASEVLFQTFINTLPEDLVKKLNLLTPEAKNLFFSELDQYIEKNEKALDILFRKCSSYYLFGRIIESWIKSTALVSALDLYTTIENINACVRGLRDNQMGLRVLIDTVRNIKAITDLKDIAVLNKLSFTPMTLVNLSTKSPFLTRLLFDEMDGKHLVSTNPVKALIASCIRNISANKISHYSTLHGPLLTKAIVYVLYLRNLESAAVVVLNYSAPALRTVTLLSASYEIFRGYQYTQHDEQKVRILHNLEFEMNCQDKEPQKTPHVFRRIKNELVCLGLQQEGVMPLYLRALYCEHSYANEIESVEVPRNGLGLFNAVSFYVQDSAETLKHKAIEYVEDHATDFKDFFLDGYEGMKQYLIDLKNNVCFPDQHIVYALSQILKRPILVVFSDERGLDFSSQGLTHFEAFIKNDPIFVYYNQAEEHYSVLLIRGEKFTEDRVQEKLANKILELKNQCAALHKETEHKTGQLLSLGSQLLNLRKNNTQAQTVKPKSQYKFT